MSACFPPELVFLAAFSAIFYINTRAANIDQGRHAAPTRSAAGVIKRDSKHVRAFRDTLRSYVRGEPLPLYKGRCVWVFRSILLSFGESER